MSVLRRLLMLAACATASCALLVSAAQAATAVGGGGASGSARHFAKAPKPKSYEFCGSEAGCGFVWNLFKKTKRWEEASGPSSGPFTTGPKATITFEVEGTSCVLEGKKVKGTKKYAGVETGGVECFHQTWELIPV